MEKTYYIGLDVGSTTAKIAVIDSDNRVIYSKYERHNARVNELVSQYFDEILALTGDAEARICVTGSVGMATAEQLQAEFVQEVVAASVYARTAHPEAKALIDIGGEDAKVIFFKKNGNMELRMNGNCAGGTGAFIDQMSVLMGVENHKMSELAMKAEHVYPMAARCGVFAKTDIQNLMARNLPEADIAASIFHSIAVPFFRLSARLSAIISISLQMISSYQKTAISFRLWAVLTGLNRQILQPQFLPSEVG